MTHVAILMAVRNGAAHLPAQLASISAQTHTDWSLHAADDGSSDASTDILRAFAAEHPNRITLADGPQAGPARNFLTLLRDAPLEGGASVAWCDQDDVWLPDRLARATAAGAPGPPVLYASRYRLLLADGSQGAASALLHRPVTFGNALVQNPLPGHTMVANPAAATLLRAGAAAAIDADVPFHDWWTCQVLTGAGAKIVFEKEPGVLYRQHAGNHVGARGGIAASLDRLRMIADGRMSDWLDCNSKALSQVSGLTPDNTALLSQFQEWRARGWRRPALATLGIWRQDRLGQIALSAAAHLQLI